MWKIGSLFDGSGGFPLAASLCGMEPMWASEVEPYPIAVTRSRFPRMVHLGDVSKVKGSEIEPVDVITFGSPCQDLSVAGKRAGLKHEDNGDDETTRSGLFMEACRIIKEMREATNGKQPAFAVWENVPGAFSSNGGEDFRTVIEELIKICEPGAQVPEMPKGGWPYADIYMGDRWSLAYRVFDAQHWGVPQRRRRIYLVLHLTGQRAGEVLFERQGLRGYFAEGRAPWQGIAAHAEGGAGADDRAGNCLTPKAIPASESGVAATLYAAYGTKWNGNAGAYNGENFVLEPQRDDGKLIAVATQQGGAEIREDGICPTITAAAGMSGNNQPYVAMEKQCLPFDTTQVTSPQNGNNPQWGDPCHPLAAQGHPPTVIIDSHILDDQGGSSIHVRTDGKSPTLRAETHGNLPIVLGMDGYNAAVTGDKAATLGVNCGVSTGRNGVVICESAGFTPNQSAKTRSVGYETEKAPTIAATMAVPGVCIKQVLLENKGNGEDTDCGERIGQNGAVIQEAAGFKAGNGAKAGGIGWQEETSPTIAAAPSGLNQAPAVAIKCYDARGNGDGEIVPTLTGDHENRVTDYTEVAVETCTCTDVGFFNSYENQSPTLLARCWKDPNLVAYPGEGAIRYIVRRLTPTECARLQGFPDTWGHITQKEALTEQEYAFWLEVRQTYDAINGRAAKDYTEKQILTWYNKLWTDSAEYKMWGNGIALPNALYVMQGIRDALDKQDAIDGLDEALEKYEAAMAELDPEEAPDEQIIEEPADDFREEIERLKAELHEKDRLIEANHQKQLTIWTYLWAAEEAVTTAKDLLREIVGSDEKEPKGKE